MKSNQIGATLIEGICFIAIMGSVALGTMKMADHAEEAVEARNELQMKYAQRIKYCGERNGR